MKKIFITLTLFGLIFAACNPNKEIYETLDEQKQPFKTDLEYTLNADDYSSISSMASDAAETEEEEAKAQIIGDILAFTKTIAAADYVGPLLDEKFVAADFNSTCMVTYRYSVNEYDSLVSYKLKADDYTAIGGDVAADGAFSQANPPENYLPDFLYAIDTTANYLMHVVSKYIPEEGANAIDTAITYTFTEGAWTQAEVYELTADDYDSMGAPGQYNNFSDGAPPENYLSSFLNERFPYTQAGETRYLVYKYYSGGTGTRMSAYKYNGQSWSKFENRSDQFVHNGEQWLFDPTVKYEMKGDDYLIVVNKVKNDPELEVYISDFGDSEYYYGASAFYGNFDMRISTRRNYDALGLLEGLSDEEAKAEIEGRLEEAIVYFAEQKFPNQEPTANGVQVFMEISYETYEPGDYYYTAKLKCIGTGEFEYIETWPVE